jgi:hypothetical protein
MIGEHQRDEGDGQGRARIGRRQGPVSAIAPFELGECPGKMIAQSHESVSKWDALLLPDRLLAGGVAGESPGDMKPNYR